MGEVGEGICAECRLAGELSETIGGEWADVPDIGDKFIGMARCSTFTPAPPLLIKTSQIAHLWSIARHDKRREGRRYVREDEGE